MILIISHFAENKGVTDYFRDYLIKNGTAHYYLRHPFYFSKFKYSQLIKFDGNNEKIVAEYKIFNNQIIELIRNFLVSLFVLIKNRKEVNKVIGFGSFNVLPSILLKKMGKTKIVFWGVDYSTKRFSNVFLNNLYLLSETAACIYSDKIIQVNERQLQTRMKKHFLKKEKAIIVPNGISSMEFVKDFSRFSNLAFLYVGSITHQHGIIDFVNYFYIKNKHTVPLYIFGGGELENQLKGIISENNLENLIEFYGYKERKEIIRFLSSRNENIFGIAPYNSSINDHVFYGDSLKIKEYLSFGISYIASDIVYIPNNLKNFGFIYLNFSDIKLMIKEDIFNKTIFNADTMKKVMKNYYWDNIFSEQII